MYNKKDHEFENVSKMEHKAFLELMELDDVIIQKVDKGNVIVIIEKTAYFTKMNSILSDRTKFRRVYFFQKKSTKMVNWITSWKKRKK